MAKKRIMMLDGHSLIHRAFYGMPDFTNAQGVHTGAVYGFLSILLMLLDQQDPDALLVAFDVHAPTFRHQMYSEYKGNRKPMPEELREQVPLMKEVLGTMNVPVIEEEGIEADDVLGSLSTAFAEKGYEVLVVSGDRDLLQLAGDDVTICIPKTKKGQTVYEFYGPDEVRDLYHVSPKEFIDVKALMGDTSDNIPGVPGVGEKTAVNLIEQYGSIEDVYEHLDEVKPPRAQKAIREHYDLAQMSKELAAIKVDADLGDPGVLFAKAELNKSEDSDPAMTLYTPELMDMFRTLNFKKFLKQFGAAESGEQVSKEKSTPTFSTAEAEDIAGLTKFIAAIPGDHPIGLALVKNESDGPLMAMLGQDVTGVMVASEAAACHCAFSNCGQQEIIEVINTAGDRHPISVIGLKNFLKKIELSQSEAFFDPSIAEYLINPLLSSYDPEDLAPIVEAGFRPPSDDAVKRAAWEAQLAAMLVKPLRQTLEETGMTDLFDKIEMPLVFTLDRIEKTGILLAKDELTEYGKNLESQIKKLQETIYGQAGEEFNINSPKQLGEILFEKMKMPHGKKTKTGYSTSAKVLDKLAEDYPFVREILSYRQLTKLNSTYAQGLVRFISDDGRIHGTFNQTVTATGRISSTDPNLQNIPIRVELGRLIRKAFVPKEGCVFVDADYSQVELRILAHLSGDPKLIEAYKNAQDIHRTTASQVFHVPLDMVTDAQRHNAKAVNFGIVYGISSFGLSEGLSISRAQAKEYIDHYFETFPGIKEFLDGAVEFAKHNGYAVTMFGRRRPIPELTAGNFMQRQFGERVAMNSPIQGAAADIMKIAMIRVEKALADAGLDAKIVVQVHDELLVEAPADEEEQVRRILKEEMEHAADLKVDLKVDVGSGANWYEAH